MLVFSAILIMRTISKLHIFRIFFSKSKRIFMKKCYPGGRRAPPWRSSPTPGVSTPTPGGKRAFPPAPFCGPAGELTRCLVDAGRCVVEDVQ